MYVRREVSSHLSRGAQLSFLQSLESGEGAGRGQKRRAECVPLHQLGFNTFSTPAYFRRVVIVSTHCTHCTGSALESLPDEWPDKSVETALREQFVTAAVTCYCANLIVFLPQYLHLWLRPLSCVRYRKFRKEVRELEKQVAAASEQREQWKSLRDATRYSPPIPLPRPRFL